VKTSDNPRLRWHQEARLGMSIHWGAYSVAGRGEWIRSSERISVADYETYIRGLAPAPGCAREWARIVKRSGAAYCILTAKHHDGFCLWDSQLTDYKISRYLPGRDIVREYVEALREEDIRVGLYYSLVDWHHPDCPAWRDRQHPLRHDPDSQGRDARCDWSRYVAYLHGQVRELLTSYGVIDLLAFDFSYWDYAGEKWGASELVRQIRGLQPDILINDRLSNEALKRGEPVSYVGDFEHVEQNIPAKSLGNPLGLPVPWDAWITLNNSWGFQATDMAYKTSSQVIRALVNCVSKDGNLTVNLSPDARGIVPAPAREILEDVGRWMEDHGDSIRGCGAAALPKPEWGRFTRRDGFLYAHILDPGIGHFALQGLRGRVKNGRLLRTGSEALICDFWNWGVQTFDGPDDIFFNFGSSTAWTYPVDDPRDTVVRFEFTTPAERKALLAVYAQGREQYFLRYPF